MEPMYICDIITPQTAVSGVYNTLSQRRGTVEGRWHMYMPVVQPRAVVHTRLMLGFEDAPGVGGVLP